MNGYIELEIGPDEEPDTFKVRVLHSAGGGRPAGRLSLDAEAILSRRVDLENAIVASTVRRRRVVSATEKTLQTVGQELFDAVFTGPVYGAYRASLGVAQEAGRRLCVVLHLPAPELAALPWEAMFDAETEAYLCRTEPLIRYVDAPYTPQPLEVRPPLQILAMVAAPNGLPMLDVEAEQQHLQEALAKPLAAGMVKLTWAPNASWDSIHDLMLGGTWHILHFVGHGGYDTSNDEGQLALVGADGRADLVEASRFADLLSEADPTPALVVLNSCSSGETGAHDLFSGTAAALVHSGISAVAAMQFSITDSAAIRFTRGFYQAIAHGRAVDEAMRSGRIEILGMANTLEWVTPVLYVRGGIRRLFILTGPASPLPSERGRTQAESVPSKRPSSPQPTPHTAESRASEDNQKWVTSFSPAEWKVVLEGPPTAGMIVIAATHGGTFRETIAMSKAYTEARAQPGGCKLLDEIAATKPVVDHTKYDSADELREHGLQHLRDAVALLESKATTKDVDAYRRFVLTLADKVAAAHGRVSPAEADAIGQIATALGATRFLKETDHARP